METTAGGNVATKAVKAAAGSSRSGVGCSGPDGLGDGLVKKNIRNFSPNFLDLEAMETTALATLPRPHLSKDGLLWQGHLLAETEGLLCLSQRCVGRFPVLKPGPVGGFPVFKLKTRRRVH